MESKFKGKFCPDAGGVCKTTNCVYYWTNGTTDSCAKVKMVRVVMGLCIRLKETLRDKLFISEIGEKSLIKKRKKVI